MTFKELIDLTKNRVNEVDPDEQVDLIIKSAINEAYIEVSKRDKRLSTAYIPIINGVATLPEDIQDIELVEPELLTGDRKIGNNILTSRTGTFKITYSALRDKLVNDNDEPDINPRFVYALSSYACYAYYLHRKKLEVANQYLNEFLSTTSIQDSSDNVKYFVQNVYAQALGDEF